MTVDQIRSKLQIAERERERLKGNIDQITSTLKQDFSVTSLKEAKNKLTEMERQLKKLQQKIEDGFERLAGMLEEDDE